MSQVWIVGPCAIEGKQCYFSEGEELIKIMDGKRWLYKASFDKANRTSTTGQRGYGLERSLDIFQEFKQKHPDIQLTTDIHECWQAERLKGIIDVIQIPAFLCRQTDLLIECGKHFNIVNVKKGQWISPESALHFIGKVRKQNPTAEVWITERGSQFGYEQLLVDFGAADELRNHFDKVILDCTHSTQCRKSKSAFTGGNRSLAERFLLASLAFSYNGIFAEVHPNPTAAISDADCQIYLKRLPRLLALYDKLSATYGQFGQGVLS